MGAMTQSWNDDRLDEFRAETADRFGQLEVRMDNGFNRVDAELRSQREEMKSEFTAVRSEMDQRFDRIDERFDRIDQRFEAMQRQMVQFSGIFIVALIGLIASPL